MIANPVAPSLLSQASTSCGNGRIRRRPQHHLRPFQRNRIAGSHHQLVQQAFRIADTARALVGNQRQRIRLNRQPLFFSQPIAAAA